MARNNDVSIASSLVAAPISTPVASSAAAPPSAPTRTTTVENSNPAGSSSGSFPIHTIAILESDAGYTRWREDIDDWLILNNLKPFTDATKPRAAVAISNRLGYNSRQLVKKYRDAYKPQKMLDTIETNYKPKGSGLYTEYVRNLHSIVISSEGGVRQYEKDFRKVTAEISDLDDSLTLPEPYLIQLFLMGLAEAYEVFVSTYT